MKLINLQFRGLNVRVASQIFIRKRIRTVHNISNSLKSTIYCYLFVIYTIYNEHIKFLKHSENETFKNF